MAVLFRLALPNITGHVYRQVWEAGLLISLNLGQMSQKRLFVYFAIRSPID